MRSSKSHQAKSEPKRTKSKARQSHVVKGGSVITSQALPIVLCVDWTYFPRCCLEDFDWSPMNPKIAPALQQSVWEARAFYHPYSDAPDVMAYRLMRVPVEKVTSFWYRVLAPGHVSKLRVCDSHENIVRFTRDLKAFQLVNFAAHHDLQSALLPKLNTGNWAVHLRRLGKLKSYTLVYPTWRRERPEPEDGVPPTGIDRLLFGDWPDAPIKATRIFVCRSSRWVAPWCDKEWLRLVTSLRKRRAASVEIDSGLQEARPFDFQNAREQEAFRLAARARFEANRGGTITNEEIEQYLPLVPEEPAD
jgi:hypothetical protein